MMPRAGGGLAARALSRSPRLESARAPESTVASGPTPACYSRSAAQRGMRSCSTPIRSRIRATTKSTRSETVSGRW